MTRVSATVTALPDFTDQSVTVQTTHGANAPLKPKQGAPQSPATRPGAELALALSPASRSTVQTRPSKLGGEEGKGGG